MSTLIGVCGGSYLVHARAMRGLAESSGGKATYLREAMLSCIGVVSQTKAHYVTSI